MKTALVLGAGGFIGNHLVNRLRDEGYWVRGVDLKYNEYQKTRANDFQLYDLRNSRNVEAVVRLQFTNGHPMSCQYTGHPYAEVEPFDEVYQLAADMGGAGYIFTGENDANVMHNSASINLNVAYWASHYGVGRLFYSSSACMYPEHNQLDPENPNCEESSAYPANPDSEYGWEKLFSERLYLAFMRNYNLDVRVARYHNIFGPYGSWDNGKEKAPAAICRKVARAQNGGEIEIWGDGQQTRSFLYIDECIEATRRLMQSDFTGPVNIGSDEMVTIDTLVDMVSQIADKTLVKNHIPGPTGVRGRNSDNRLILQELGWAPSASLIDGLTNTYAWINNMVQNNVKDVEV
jgi:nucleoside-diphosphate-sugar epimerase